MSHGTSDREGETFLVCDRHAPLAGCSVSSRTGSTFPPLRSVRLARRPLAMKITLPLRYPKAEIHCNAGHQQRRNANYHFLYMRVRK